MFNVVLDPCWMMLLFTSNQALFPMYWLDHCHNKFIDLLKQNYDDKDSMKGVNIISQLTMLLNEMDDLFSDPSLVNQSAEDASGNSIEDKLGCYLNDGRYKPGAGKDKSPLCWWKDNEHHFPWLAQCACNVLAIPGMLHSAFISLLILLLCSGSLVSVEQALSVGCDVIGICCATLSAETIRVLMLYCSQLMMEASM